MQGWWSCLSDDFNCIISSCPAVSVEPVPSSQFWNSSSLKCTTCTIRKFQITDSHPLTCTDIKPSAREGSCKPNTFYALLWTYFTTQQRGLDVSPPSYWECFSWEDDINFSSLWIEEAHYLYWLARSFAGSSGNQGLVTHKIKIRKLKNQCLQDSACSLEIQVYFVCYIVGRVCNADALAARTKPLSRCVPFI